MMVCSFRSWRRSTRDACRTTQPTSLRHSAWLDTDVIRLGVFFRDESRPTYDVLRRPPRRSMRERLEQLNQELDKHAV
jgi:hypothetical protein